MGIQVPRYVIAVAAGLLLVPAASAGAAGSPSSINPSAAAATCTPSAHAGRPTTPNIARLSSLASCVLRAERKQLGLGYAQSRTLSQMVDVALKQFVALPYLAQQQAQLIQPAELAAGDSIVRSFCKSAGPGVSHGSWQFANRAVPPAPTALELARTLAGGFAASDATARAPGAKFGVAVRSGLLFRQGDRKGVSVGVIAVTCS